MPTWRNFAKFGRADPSLKVIYCRMRSTTTLDHLLLWTRQSARNAPKDAGREIIPNGPIAKLERHRSCIIKIFTYRTLQLLWQWKSLIVCCINSTKNNIEVQFELYFTSFSVIIINEVLIKWDGDPQVSRNSWKILLVCSGGLIPMWLQWTNN